jgi:Arc/MetJ family transcription regulator
MGEEHKRKLRDAEYSVYNIHTDEFVMQGTVRQICNRLDITKSTVCRAVDNNSVVRRKYRIYYDGGL